MRTATTNGMLRVGDPRDIEIASYEVEREGIIKFKPIYEALHGFFFEKGFRHPQDGGDKWEDLYWERWMQAGHKEQHIWWRLRKEINPYIAYYVQLDFQTLLVSPADTQHKGKKIKKTEFTDLIIRPKIYLQFDIHDKFKNSMGWKFKKAFFNHIYSAEIDQHQAELYEFSQELRRLLKHLLEMQADKPYQTTFEPQMGYKEP